MSAEPIGQRHSVDKVTHDVDLPARPPDFVHADNVGVFQLCGCTSFAQELLDVDFGNLIAARHFNGNGAIELRVAGLPDRAETTDTDLFNQFELTDRGCFVPSCCGGFVTDQAELAVA